MKQGFKHITLLVSEVSALSLNGII